MKRFPPEVSLHRQECGSVVHDIDNTTALTPTTKKPGCTHLRLHACRLLALAVFIVLSAAAQGQTPVFINDVVFSGDGGAAAGIKEVACGPHSNIKHGTGCVAKIGDVVSLEVGNLAAWLEKLKTGKVIESAETGNALVVQQVSKLNLFIGEHLMRSLHPTRYLKDDPGWYPNDPEQRKAAPDRSWLEFTLKRDASDKVSRADWDPVLRTPGTSPKMQLAVGIYDANKNIAHVMALPEGAKTTDSRLEFHLNLIAWEGWTMFGLILLGVAIVVFLYLLVRSGIVRDTTCPVREDGLPPLSLGRCQMAFWFFLVIGAFYFIWIITGRGDTDTINSTVLTLIGISAGTALGSVIVSKNEGTTSAAAKNEAAKAAYPNQIKDAQRALAAAKADRKKIDPSDKAALVGKDAEIEARAERVAQLKADLKDWRKENRSQLVLDLLSEEDASADRGRVITFHRFQIVVWTLILGIVFVSEVFAKLAMPVFDNTLLTLMGISSGTYLGFKVSK